MTIKRTAVRKPEIWDAMINSLFEGQPILSPEDSIIVARKLYRHAMGKAWKGPVKLTSGNRYTWIKYGVMYVNPDKREAHTRGLRSIIHDLSHYCHWKLNPHDSPHSLRQARLEAKLAKFAIARNWHTGVVSKRVKDVPEPLSPVVKVKPDKVNQRYRKMVSRRDKWGKQFERAERLYNKAVREVRAYEKRHGDRLTSLATIVK